MYVTSVYSFSPSMILSYTFPVQVQVSPVLSERLQVFESLRDRKSCEERVEASEKPLRIQLADGRTVKGTAGVTTPQFVAQSVR